jgi:hypothetical protein
MQREQPHNGFNLRTTQALTAGPMLNAPLNEVDLSTGLQLISWEKLTTILIWS